MLLLYCIMLYYNYTYYYVIILYYNVILYYIIIGGVGIVGIDMPNYMHMPF